MPSQPDPESNWVNDNTTAGKLKGLKEFCEGCKAGNGIENGIAYLDDDDVVTEAEITYTVDGSITFDAPLYGDVNCDGKITTADASLLLRAVVGLETLRSRQALNADTNCDGALTAEDAVLILRYVVGLIDAFPADAQ